MRPPVPVLTLEDQEEGTGMINRRDFVRLSIVAFGLPTETLMRITQNVDQKITPNVWEMHNLGMADMKRALLRGGNALNEFEIVLKHGDRVYSGKTTINHLAMGATGEFIANLGIVPLDHEPIDGMCHIKLLSPELNVVMRGDFNMTRMIEPGKTIVVGIPIELT